MIISSVIVKCLNGSENALSKQLGQIGGVSVEGVFNGDIILALESPSLDQAVHTLEKQITSLPGVAGAYPVYINTES